MIAAFHFEEDGRKYSCRVEESRAARAEPWWWFGVSGDTHRYAPFHAAPGDTQDSVRARIVTYYTELLFRRSQPAQHWARRGKRPAAPVAQA
ncbi:MAG: hypothetical protein M3373_12135 [Gemmatimonadota bacterium]|nr:hypothetical protein [Gemmatimonadota bacterium]